MTTSFQGIFISAELYLNKKLCLLEKIFLVEMSSLSKNGTIFLNKEYFIEFLKVSKKSLSKMIRHLIELGKIEQLDKNHFKLKSPLTFQLEG